MALPPAHVLDALRTKRDASVPLYAAMAARELSLLLPPVAPDEWTAHAHRLDAVLQALPDTVAALWSGAGSLCFFWCESCEERKSQVQLACSVQSKDNCSPSLFFSLSLCLSLSLSLSLSLVSNIEGLPVDGGK